MNKLFYAILVGSMAVSLQVKASGDFFDDLIVTDEMKKEAKENKTIEKGQMDATKILESRPKMLKIQSKRRRGRVEEVTVETAAPVVYEKAPLGLLWLAPVSEIEYIKVKLEPITLKDYPKSYKATNLPKPLSDFRETVVSFGEKNKLWRIVSYGNFMEDDTSATKGLKQYDKYHNLLDKKYGNAEDFYTPATYNVEELVPNDDGTTSMAIKQMEMEIGEEGFLEKLSLGEAVMYSTFHNENVSVTLALLADGNKQTYIVIEYKNIDSQKKATEDIMDAL
ncbi:MAG: hypothetical protein IJW75_06570 [Alphaproteobacteria bacterium]|nr:hypothetical protein [Alphaproteobacteria bacterium]